VFGVPELELAATTLRGELEARDLIDGGGGRPCQSAAIEIDSRHR
jgi:hypothetical protein